METTFKEGNMVTWSQHAMADETLRSVIKNAIATFGEGPFEVMSTVTVPARCACGGSFFDEHHRHQSCPYRQQSLRRAVDHHQWVTIVAGAGRRTFSGALLEVIEGGCLNEAEFKG